MFVVVCVGGCCGLCVLFVLLLLLNCYNVVVENGEIVGVR